MHNELIASMKEDDLTLVRPHLEVHELAKGSIFRYENGGSIVLFPTKGFLSVLVTAGGRETEMSLVGREGLVGAPTILALDLGPYRAVARHDCEALGIPAETLRRLIASHRPIAAVVLRYVRGVVSQLVHTTVANAHLSLPQRLAYWLLIAGDRAEGAPLEVGHGTIATALGAGRAAVSRALREVQGRGAIRLVARAVEIVDRPLLVAMADGLYAEAEAPTDPAAEPATAAA